MFLIALEVKLSGPIFWHYSQLILLPLLRFSDLLPSVNVVITQGSLLGSLQWQSHPVSRLGPSRLWRRYLCFIFSLMWDVSPVVSTAGYLPAHFLTEVFIISNLDHHSTLLPQFPFLISFKPVVLNLDLESPGKFFFKCWGQRFFFEAKVENHCLNYSRQALLPGTLSADPSCFPLIIKTPCYCSILLFHLFSTGEKEGRKTH